MTQNKTRRKYGIYSCMPGFCRPGGKILCLKYLNLIRHRYCGWVEAPVTGVGWVFGGGASSARAINKRRLQAFRFAIKIQHTEKKKHIAHTCWTHSYLLVVFTFGAIVPPSIHQLRQFAVFLQTEHCQVYSVSESIKKQNKFYKIL